MIAWMLSQVEKSPSSLFRRSELLKKSKSEFEKLSKTGFLLYDQPDEDGAVYPCPVSDCGNGCPMDVEEINGKLFAVCPVDGAVKLIPLIEDDVSRYRFSLDKFISEIRRDNGITGSDYRITPRLHFIGERVVDDINTAFVLALFPSIQAAEAPLLSLPARLPAHYARTVVVTPTLNLSRDPIYPKLRAASIFPVTFPATFGKRDFKFSYLAALKKRPPSGAPALTPAQFSDYEKFGYKCQDRLHVPGEFPKDRKNMIFLNGQEIRLGDKLFALLLRFVVELKKSKGGWVSTSDLVSGGFINDYEHRQPFSNLRTALKGRLYERDGQKFIESDGSKHYRLSTHPDFVTFDLEKLKTHPDPKVRKIICS